MQKNVPQSAVLIPDRATCAFQGELFAVFQWQQELFDGSIATFEMLRRPDTTSVICVVDDKLLVLDEEQPNSGKRQSFPGGRVEASDESIITAAQREVLEETGYSFRQWRVVKVYQPASKLEWFVHIVLAWDAAEKVEPTHEPGEKITVEQLALDEVKRLAAEGVGFLGESAELLDQAETVYELTRLPAYTGKTITR